MAQTIALEGIISCSVFHFHEDRLIFRFHELRHTFATRCYEKSVKEKVVQKILGRSKIDMTLNVYTHTTDEMIEEDLRKLED